MNNEHIRFDTHSLLPEEDDPNIDIDDYLISAIEEEVGCEHEVGWYFIDDGTLDTVIQVKHGYEITDDGRIVPIEGTISEEMVTRVYNDVEMEVKS